MERLGSLDAVFLAIEDPVSPMNIGSVSVFAGPAPPFEDVRAFVAEKLPLVPRCRQRVRRARHDMARPVWIDDVDFDLDRHLHRTTLPAGEPLALESLVAEIMVTRLDRERPLWELWVVRDLADDQWAIISKIHHCMVDGLAGTDLLAVMLDTDAAAEHAPSGAWMPAPEPSSLDIARFGMTRTAASIWAHVKNLGGMLVRPRRTWHRLRDFFIGAKGLWLQPRRKDSPLTGPIGPRRRWAHLRIPLADVATIRRSLGGTVNDVVLTAVALGFRELLATWGEPLDGRSVMALVPVSATHPRRTRHVSTIELPLPTHSCRSGSTIRSSCTRQCVSTWTI